MLLVIYNISTQCSCHRKKISASECEKHQNKLVLLQLFRISFAPPARSHAAKYGSTGGERICRVSLSPETNKKTKQAHKTRRRREKGQLWRAAHQCDSPLPVNVPGGATHSTATASHTYTHRDAHVVALHGVNYLWWRATSTTHFLYNFLSHTHTHTPQRRTNPVFSFLPLSYSGLQGEPCLMGVKRIYRKLKPTSRCVMGKTYSVSMASGPCDCTEADFEW